MTARLAHALLMLAAAAMAHAAPEPAESTDPGHRSALAIGAAPAGDRMEFLPLRPLLFAHDVDALDDAGRALAEEIAAFIRQDPRIRRVLVKGFADVIAGGPYNEALSTRRAEAVRSLLAELGVPAWMLHVTAHGNSAPVDEEWTPEGRARNRRVEIYVVRETF